jgi:hypothetical protein
MKAMLAALLLTTGAALAQAMPQGFVVETLASGLHGPIALDFLPDGRVLFAEQHTGAVKVLCPAGGNAVATLGTVPDLVTSYSQGLLALAVDPQWPARPFVYCYHSNATAGDLRVTRFAVTGSLSAPASTNLLLGGSYTVLTGIPDTQPEHEAGCLRFLPDGTLLCSTGDDLDPCSAQDVTSLAGKLLRLRVDALPTGTGTALRAQLVPNGNPYSGPGDVAPLVWASGLRNPFSFHVDPADGAVFVADVGEAQRDEIDRITAAGANLGWPWHEADLPHGSCTSSAPPAWSPIAVQDIPTGVFLALISLGVCRVPANAPYRFGPGYDGDHFYTDHFSGRIWRLHDDGSGWAAAPPVPGQAAGTPWATGVPWIADAQFGADGALYVCERQFSTTGSLRRIRPTAATFAPFGSGCAGTFGTPVLAAAPGSLPVLGGTFTMQLTGLGTQPALGLGMLGISKSQWDSAPLPLDLTFVGLINCTLAMAPLFSTPLLLPGASATWPWAIPLQADLFGQEFYAQALVLDAAANPFGAVLSNGGEGVIR